MLSFVGQVYCRQDRIEKGRRAHDSAGREPGQHFSVLRLTDKQKHKGLERSISGMQGPSF